jgi:hypothetical protein
MLPISRAIPITLVFIAMACVASLAAAQAPELYRKPKDAVTRWSSFENLNGVKGAGGQVNQGAKGNAAEPLKAGESKVLLDVAGSGLITRMWFTTIDRSPEMLRGLKLEMFWDGAATPAVAVPLADFFGAILAKPVPFEGALFSNPEGRSFNCFVPMPFRTAAKVVITNESGKDLGFLFFNVDFVLGVEHPADTLYFHAHWRRERPTTVGKDFEILPKVHGAGRFLGAHIGLFLNKDNPGWWGEGEVKMYVDGDTNLPTLAGTGTEDYVGTAWGQGLYDHQYQGSLLTDADKGTIAFYRYHVADPIYFNEDMRVTIQQIGGHYLADVRAAIHNGVPIKPVTLHFVEEDRLVRLLDEPEPVDLDAIDASSPVWCNYYRQDDVCAAAFFYLDKPENGLPPLQPASERIAALDLIRDKPLSESTPGISGGPQEPGISGGPQAPALPGSPEGLGISGGPQE